MNQPLLVLDTASLYYRSYYALPSSMVAPDGHPHHAVRGFFTTLAKLVDRVQPVGVVAGWDADWRPQWRVDLVPSYKTHRLAVIPPADSASLDVSAIEAEPETLGPQVQAIGQILDAWGVPRIGIPGFEADDVVATVARLQQGPSILVTGDRDLLQLARPGVSVMLTAKGGMEQWPLLDADGVYQRTGVTPDRYVEFAVLRGDASDGLPGVRGIGEKTAAALVSAYPDLPALMAAAAHPPFVKPLTPRLAGAITDSAGYIEAATTVTTLRDDCFTQRSFAPPREPVDPPELARLCSEWGVTRYVDEAINAVRINCFRL